jgi:hypothetical protein
MSINRLLFDENVPLVIQSQLEQAEITLQLYTIGDDIAPKKGTPDLDILIWVETHDCLLVTNNRATMPVHLHDHLAQGHHVPDIIQLPKRMNVGKTLEDLLLICPASESDEFQDQILYLPFHS